MTNDTRPTVPPISGHYAMLRNGEISLNHIPYFRKNSPCAWECPTSGAKWLADGKSYNGRHLDIIATISPSMMKWAADLKALAQMITEEVRKIMEPFAPLIAAADAACDYADQHCRWFDISTVPMNGGSQAKFWIFYTFGHSEEAWSYANKIWVADQDGCDCQVLLSDLTHWRPLPPPPSNPPLPAVFTELGAALEKIKGAG
jgi:hypothetical protein